MITKILAKDLKQLCPTLWTLYDRKSRHLCHTIGTFLINTTLPRVVINNPRAFKRLSTDDCHHRLQQKMFYSNWTPHRWRTRTCLNCRTGRRKAPTLPWILVAPTSGWCWWRWKPEKLFAKKWATTRYKRRPGSGQVSCSARPVHFV